MTDEVTLHKEELLERVGIDASKVTDATTAADCVALASCLTYESDLKTASSVIAKVRGIRMEDQSDAWVELATLYTEGMILLGNNSVASAKMKFAEILRRDPFFVLAHLGHASIHMVKKDYRAAFTQYKKVLEALGSLAPPVVRVGLGVCCLYLKRVGHARKCLERALELDGNDVLALRVLFVVALRQEDLVRVTSSIMKLAELSPSDPLVIQRYVDVLFHKARQDGKVAEFEQTMLSLVEQAEEIAGEEKGVLAYSQFQRGRLHHALRRYATAKGAYAEAVQHLPNLLPARVGLAKVLHFLGEEEESFTILQQLNHDAPDDLDVLAMLTAVYSNRGQHHQAAKLASRITNTNAAGLEDVWHLAAHANRLDRQQSDKFLLNAIKIGEKEGTRPSWQIRANLASLNDNLNGIADVVKEVLGSSDAKTLTSKSTLELTHVPLLLDYARLSMKADPQGARSLCIFVARHHCGLAEPFYLLHQIAFDQKREREAVTWMNVLMSLDPENVFTSVTIADMYLQHGGTQANYRAYEVLNKQKDISKQTVPTLARAIIYLREAQRSGKQGQLAHAILRFKAVLKQDPGNIMAAHGLACCTALQGDSNAGSSMFQRVIEVKSNVPQVQQNTMNHSVTTQIRSGTYRAALALAAKNTDKPSATQLSELAFAHMSMGDFDAATNTIDQALAMAQEEGDEGNSSMIQYNKALIIISGIVASLRKTTGLDEEQAERIKQRLHTAREVATAAANGRYKQDGGQAVFFLKELLSELAALEKERQRQFRRGQAQLRQSTVLDEEWRQMAAEEKERAEAERLETQREEEEKLRIRADRSRAQLERVQSLMASWAGDAPAPLAAEEEELELELGGDEAGNGTRKRSREQNEVDSAALPDSIPADGGHDISLMDGGYDATLDVNGVAGVEATLNVNGTATQLEDDAALLAALNDNLDEQK